MPTITVEDGRSSVAMRVAVQVRWQIIRHPATFWLCIVCCRCTVEKTWALQWNRTLGSSILVRRAATSLTIKPLNAVDVLTCNCVYFSFSSGRPTGVVGGITRRHIRVQRRTRLLVQLIAKQGTSRSVQSLQFHCWPGTRWSTMLSRIVEFHANHIGCHGSYITQDRAQRYIQTTFSTITKPPHTGMYREPTKLYFINDLMMNTLGTSVCPWRSSSKRLPTPTARHSSRDGWGWRDNQDCAIG